MSGREAKPGGVETLGFDAPLEFLDGFVDARKPFEGLYTHFASELDLGNEDGVRGYVEELAFDVKDQGAYGRLLHSLIEQGASGYQTPPRFKPQLQAATNWMKYRLAVGVMEPAVDFALADTVPEHNRLRIHQTLVAADMVRVLINDTFAGDPNSARPTSFLDQDVAAHLRQQFSRKYRGSDEAIVERYLNGTTHMEHLDRASDGPRFFDIKDFSTRLLYPIRKDNGELRLPDADELAEILERQIRPYQVSFSQNGSNGNSANGDSLVIGSERNAVIRQTLLEAFDHTGLLDLRADDHETIGVIPVAPEFGVVSKEIARATAATLLSKLNDGYKVFGIESDGTRTEASSAVHKRVRSRLISIIDRNSNKLDSLHVDGFMQIDDFLALLEADYTQRYGELPVYTDRGEYGD